MSWRNLKRVDYSKFGKNGVSSDESDDDFQQSPVPPPSKKKVPKTEVKRKNDKKKCGLAAAKPVTSEPIVKPVSSEPKKRKTRISNADKVYEEDLLTAIEFSKDDTPKFCQHTSRRNSLDKVKDVKTNKRYETVSRLGNDESSSMESVIHDTVPYQHQNNENLKTCEYMKDDTKEEEDRQKNTLPLQERNIKNNDKNLNSSQNLDMQSDTCSDKNNSEGVSKNHHFLSKSSNNKKKINVSVTSSVTSQISFSVKTPARLRIGLSRNDKITKPLHPNASPHL